MTIRWLLLLTGLLLTQANYARQTNDSPDSLWWALHSWANHHVVFSTQVQTDFAGLGAQGQDTSLTGQLRGTMRTECVGMTADRQFFHAFFPTIDRCRFPLPASVQQSIQGVLSGGFYYSRSYAGLVDSIWFPAAVTDAAEHVVVQLLEPFQWSYPVVATEGEQPVMALSDGLARARFRQIADDSCTQACQLDSLAWIYPGGQTGVLARRIKYMSDSRYCFDQQRVRSIAGRVVRKAKVNHKTVTILTNIFSYRLAGAGSGGRVKDMHYTAFYQRPLYYPGRLELKVKEDLLAKSRRLTIAGLLKALRQNESLGDVNRQDLLAEAVKICFVAEKDSLELLRKAFIAAPVNSITFKTLRTGIVTASTPYAQQVLGDFISLNKDAADKLKKVIPSAGLVRTPMPALQQLLEKLAVDVHTGEPVVAAAVLALGNMAGTIRLVERDRADSLTERLGNWLQAHGDEMLLLSVMGNSGTQVAVPYILPLLTNTDTTVRAYAYYALRFIQSPLVDSVYGTVLTKEQHPVILTNVFNALFLRTGNEMLKAALLKLVEHADEPVRLEALQVLFEWSYREPALLTVFRELAVSNTSGAVKKAARQFLARADE